MSDIVWSDYHKCMSPSYSKISFTCAKSKVVIMMVTLSGPGVFVMLAPRQPALSNYALIFYRNVGHMPFMQHCNRNRSLVNCAKFGADVSVRELIMER